MEDQVKNLAIVMDSKGVGVYSFPTIEQANAFKRVTEIPPGGMILVTRGVEGLRAVATSFLVELYNLVTTASPVKKFEKKEIALRRVYAALTEVAEEKTMVDVKEPKARGKGEAPPKVKKPSYHDKIREHFKTNDVATLQKIMEITGADKRNARVAMSIIQNPKRVKNPMAFDYVKSSKTYYLLDDGFGRKGPVREKTAETGGMAGGESQAIN